MKHALDLFRFDGRVTRRQYVAAGLVLFAIKYATDHLCRTQFHHAWNPLMYVSPRLSPLLQFPGGREVLGDAGRGGAAVSVDGAVADGAALARRRGVAVLGGAVPGAVR